MKEETKSIIYSSIGLISLAAGLLLGLINTGFGVHSGEFLIWLLFLVITIFVLPLVFFLLSIYALRTLGQGKTKIKTYSIAVMSILGAGLVVTTITTLVFMNN